LESGELQFADLMRMFYTNQVWQLVEFLAGGGKKTAGIEALEES